MSEHTRKHHTKSDSKIIRMHHAGVIYQFPRKIAEKYRIDDDKPVSASEVFSIVNKKYTKPGAIVRGIRVRESLTQAEMAKKIKVTQSDISQMENGTPNISHHCETYEKLFDVDYRSFLE